MKITDIFQRRPAVPNSAYQPPQPDTGLDRKLAPTLQQRLADLREMVGNTGDLIVNELTVCGIDCAVVMCEGMVATAVFAELFAEPLTALRLDQPTPEKLLGWVRHQSLLAPDQKEFQTYGDLTRFIMSGFVVLLAEGVEPGLAFGIQGYDGRSVSEPAGESNERGSREGFIEKLRPNLALVRRRFKSADLTFEMVNFGVKSRTDGALVYLRGAVSPELLEEVRRRLSQVKIDVVLESGYLQPFLDAKPLSIFSGVGYTERPDTLCAKVSEGRIGLLVDGTPYALVVPYLFNEHFQSFDDYAHRPYFATFIRWLKYAAFLFSFLLPGLYVGLGSFHPELLPKNLLLKLAQSESVTPLPLMFEALLIFFIYEIMREAGLRMPKSVGHAVSIVGALVIGDAAVTAGLIGAPMVRNQLVCRPQPVRADYPAAVRVHPDRRGCGIVRDRACALCGTRKSLCSQPVRDPGYQPCRAVLTLCDAGCPLPGGLENPLPGGFAGTGPNRERSERGGCRWRISRG